MKTIVIDNGTVILNDRCLETLNLNGMAMLTAIYKRYAINYPKFYKMDPLCRLGFIAAELLFSENVPASSDNHAIVTVGYSGSIVDDMRYQNTIDNERDYFPSPAVFVYTLANIVTGEIAIRNKIYGESSSYLIEKYDPEAITTLLLTAFADNDINTITGGWINCETDDSFHLRFVTVDRSTSTNDILNFFKLNKI